MTKYIGITIGPIFDTINLSSTPAAMWVSSFVFSYISHSLCEKIIGAKIVTSEKEILQPYYDNEVGEKQKKGYGLFPDHIVLRPEKDKKVKDLESIFEQVKKEVIPAFILNPKDNNANKEDWLKEYFQFQALEFEAKTDQEALKKANNYLNALEFERNFPTVQVENPINEVFETFRVDVDKNGEWKEEWEKNDRIRKKFWETFFGEDFGEEKKLLNFLFAKGSSTKHLRLQTLGEIIGREKEDERGRIIKNNVNMKTSSYYAIVSADGDNFSKYVDSIEDEGVLRKFSKKVFDYSAEVADKVKEFGGNPIYVGGDDLLFIVPLHKRGDEKNSENIFTLLEDIRKVFDERFKNDTFMNECTDSKKSLTLSIGLAIRYYKYPLYEAFSEVEDLLDKQAKKNKNAFAISLIKHSGKSIEFVIENYTEAQVLRRIKKLIADSTKALKGEANGKKRDLLQSIPHLIAENHSLFEIALKENTPLEHIFNNIFDSNIHQEHKKEIDDVRELLGDLTIKTQISKSKDTLNVLSVRELRYDEEKKMCDKEKILSALDVILRFVKFWQEKAGE